MKKLLITLLSCCYCLAAGAANSDLPDIGSSAAAVISPSQEYQLGRMIVRGLRDSDQILDDPELNEYIQTIGDRIVAFSDNEDTEFNFFVVDDPRINAFALPGGFIGINTGLIAATRNESELASVVAHEIAHVTQKHIARQIEAASRGGLVSAASMLAAVLIGVVSGSADAAQAGIMAAQGASIQSQINFTRNNEYEADRIGIKVLADAGFDPNGMATFFDQLGRRSTFTAEKLPEILSTHPVDTSRISEARNRARKHNIDHEDSLEYGLAKARIVLLLASTKAQAMKTFERDALTDDESVSNRYGRALTYSAVGRHGDAENLLARLVDQYDETMEFHSALGQAQLAAGKDEEALATFEQAHKLFPRNTPVTVRYSEALLATGDAEKAHELMLDLLNNKPPTPKQVRLIALAAGAAGETANAHYYMAEFHIINGDLQSAKDQLKLAIFTPEINEVQHARFRARLDEIEEFLARSKRQRRRRG
ncbi:MAG: M48 family metalloprotease [Pseudomonadota bacterium]